MSDDADDRKQRERAAIGKALEFRLRSVNERGFFLGRPANHEAWSEGVLDGLRAFGLLPEVPRP